MPLIDAREYPTVLAATPPQLPPLASVALALRSTTEWLARELAAPQEAAPDSLRGRVPRPWPLYNVRQTLSEPP